MLSCKLAKKLKDAGFPQIGKSQEWYSNKFDIIKAEFQGNKAPYNKNIVYIPTLSELIEACGDKFQILFLHKGDSAEGSKKGWRAGSSVKIYPDKNDENYFEYLSSRCEKSPEVAVAKLWLKLE